MILFVRLFVFAQDWISNIESQLAMHANFLRENAHSANALREEREVLNLLVTVRKEKGATNLSIPIHIYMFLATLISHVSTFR